MGIDMSYYSAYSVLSDIVCPELSCQIIVAHEDNRYVLQFIEFFIKNQNISLLIIDAAFFPAL